MPLHRFRCIKKCDTIGVRTGDTLIHDDVTGDVSLVRRNILTPAHLSLLTRNACVVPDPLPVDAPMVRGPRDMWPPRGGPEYQARE